MNENNYLTKRETLLLIALIGSALIILGYFFQINVITANNGKMPVLNYNGQNDYEYVLLSNETSFNNLADRFKIPFVDDYFSLGDVFLILGMSLSISSLIVYIIFLFQDKKIIGGKNE